MSFASKHNKVNRWNIDTKGFEYRKIKELVAEDGENVVYKVHGVMVNRGGRYGDSPCAILENCFVNLPKHMAEEVSNIIDSAEDRETIQAGKVGIEFYSYESASGNVCYSANWVDL